jgi:hypothetical protein
MKKKMFIYSHEGKNYIVVDNEAFDWEIDPSHIKSVETKIKNDPLMKENFIGDIFNHVVESFSEFLGKKVSLKDINEALERGWIEV